jgi:hypothetical protein
MSPSDLSTLFHADKMIAIQPDWAQIDSECLVVVSSLQIDDVVIEGLRFRATAKSDCPTKCSHSKSNIIHRKKSVDRSVGWNGAHFPGTPPGRVLAETSRLIKSANSAPSAQRLVRKGNYRFEAFLPEQPSSRTHDRTRRFSTRCAVTSCNAVSRSAAVGL